MFCMFLLSFHSVSVRNSATRISFLHSVWTTFSLTHSWINRSDKLLCLETKLITGLLPKQPPFNVNNLTNLVSKSIFHWINGILLATSKFGQCQLVMKNLPEALCQWETLKYFKWLMIIIILVLYYYLLIVNVSPLNWK